MCHPDPIMGGDGEDVRPVERVEVPTGGEQMPGFVAQPEGDTPAPAILIISDIFGASRFYQDMAGQLAHAGYLALLPDLFFRLGRLPEPTIQAAGERAAKLTDAQCLADLNASFEFLQNRSDVEPKQPGVIGFCMGGTLALLTASRRQDIGGTAVFYGFPVNRRPSENKPLSPIDEVAGISTPMIGFWGDQDAGVGMENVERLQQEMQRLNKDFACTIYKGAGHAFMARRSEADAEAASDAWPAMLQFFDKTLGVSSVAAH